ncbi:MAG: hypothetical protein U0790_17545 [Isosphaeraceae bacterium]
MQVKQLGMIFGLVVLVPLLVTAGVYLALAADRFARGHARALAQKLVIHHFERSSWFALNAGKLEGVDPDLAARFRESAAWHAQRARAFQRMDPAAAALESERDAPHDLSDGRLMERALKLDASCGKGEDIEF